MNEENTAIANKVFFQGPTPQIARLELEYSELQIYRSYDQATPRNDIFIIVVNIVLGVVLTCLKNSNFVSSFHCYLSFVPRFADFCRFIACTSATLLAFREKQRAFPRRRDRRRCCSNNARAL